MHPIPNVSPLPSLQRTSVTRISSSENPLRSWTFLLYLCDAHHTNLSVCLCFSASLHLTVRGLWFIPSVCPSFRRPCLWPDVVPTYLIYTSEKLASVLSKGPCRTICPCWTLWKRFQVRTRSGQTITPLGSKQQPFKSSIWNKRFYLEPKRVLYCALELDLSAASAVTVKSGPWEEDSATGVTSVSRPGCCGVLTFLPQSVRSNKTRIRSFPIQFIVFIMT